MQGLAMKSYTCADEHRCDITKHPQHGEEDMMKNMKWLLIVVMSVGFSVALGGLT